MANLSCPAFTVVETGEDILASLADGLTVPARIVLPTSWVGHVPFASWIVAALKPAIVVELGVHTGNSFFTFAESAAVHRLPTQLYGIDTWAGDAHAGRYAEDVYADVSAVAVSRFPDSVHLLRKYFDEALDDVADGSVDLLHIDGLHTYEAVKHDFETWRPKLSNRGVVLFHDIAVKKEGFGVAQFWQEITQSHRHFAFSHSNGLGVLLVGRDIPSQVELFAHSSIARQGLLALCEKLGTFLIETLRRGPDVVSLPVNPTLDPPRIYLGIDGAFDESQASDAVAGDASPGALKCTFPPLPDAGEITLRIDPMNHVGIRGIHRVLVSGPNLGQPIELEPVKADRRVNLSIVPVDKGYLYLAIGEDSQWYPSVTPEMLQMFRAGATLTFEPMAVPNARLGRLLLDAIRTLVAPLQERIELLQNLEKNGSLALAEGIAKSTRAAAAYLPQQGEVVAEANEPRPNEPGVADVSSFMRAMSASIDALVAEVDELRSSLEEQEARATALGATLAASEAAGAEQASELARMVEENHCLSTEIVDLRKTLEAEVARVTEANNRLSASLADMAVTLDEASSMSSELQKELTASDLARNQIRNDAARTVSSVAGAIVSLRAAAELHTPKSLEIAIQAIDALSGHTAPQVAGIGKELSHLMLINETAKGRYLVERQRHAWLQGVTKSVAVENGGSRTHFLEPLRGLVPLDTSAQHWRAVDQDPQFEFSELLVYAGRWVELTVHLEFNERRHGNPIVYLDDGDGMSERTAIKLPRPSFDTGLSTIIFPVSPKLRDARLDPCTEPSEFKMTSVAIRVLSKWRAMRGMARAMKGTGRFEQLRSDHLPHWRSMRTFTARRRLKGDFVQAYRSTIQSQSSTYNEWIKLFETPRASYEALIAARASWSRQPVISVIMPTYNTSPRLLRESIESVIEQIYPAWELCIADDASKSPHVRRLLNEFVMKDPRIKVVFRETNGHISEASNSALQLASGEFVALLDHDDRLHPLALHHVAEAILHNPAAQLIYSDEDKISVDGARSSPHFKCEFNYPLFLAQNMINHLGCYRTETVRKVGGFRKGFEGSQDWDLALRVLDTTEAANVVHIPHVLYHWREVPGSTALATAEKPYAQIAGRLAVTEHLERRKIAATVVPSPEVAAWNRVKYALPDVRPKVSIVIPTRDKADVLKTCVDSLLMRTSYDNVEIIIVDNGSIEPETAGYFATLPPERVHILRDESTFNYSRINNLAVRHSTGDLICLLNNDTEVLNEGWLEEMVSIALQPSVGIVGARLWYPDERLQHAGVILGIGGVAGHVHRLLKRGDPGYFGRAVLQQQFSAVTAACLMIPRRIWDEVGGLDETLEVAFNDIDLCLRVRTAGYQIVWTPYAELIHYESLSRGLDDTPEKVLRFEAERAAMRLRWRDILFRDPAYSPNLSLTADDFSISWEPRK